MSSKSHIKPYDPGENDLALKKELQEWRRHTALKKFRAATVQTLGVRILMSDEILQRLVDGAHVRKITTVEQLSKETGWTKERVDEFGEDILAIIQKCSPLMTTEEPTPRKRNASRCSGCGEVGHISTTFFFYRIVNC